MARLQTRHDAGETQTERQGQRREMRPSVDHSDGPPQWKRKASRRTLALTIQLSTIAGLLILWEVSARAGWVDKFFVSTPSDIAQFFWTNFRDGEITNDAWVTFKEAAQGFVYGTVIGVAIGFLLGQSALLTAAYLPLVNLANSLPRVALAPLFILWFGIGPQSKVALVFTVIVVIMIFNTHYGTQTVDRHIVINARLLGASRFEVMRKITLPWCLPWIFAGMRMSMAWALGSAVIGEYLASREGLGFRIAYYSGALDQTGLLAMSLALLIMSALMFASIGVFERYLLRWRPDTGTSDSK